MYIRYIYTLVYTYVIYTVKFAQNIFSIYIL